MTLLDVVPGPPLVPLAPDPEMLRAVKKYLGAVPLCLTYLTDVPWVFEAFRDVMKPPVFTAPGRLVELIGWATSFESSCRHCYGAQRAMLRILGYDDAWIERVERDAQLADVDPDQRGVLELARKLARSNPRPARAEREQLTAQYGAAVAAELAFVVAGWCFATRMATFLRIPPDPTIESLSRRWFRPLLRPLFRLAMHKPVRRPTTLPPDGPFHAVLEGMGPAVPVTSLVRDWIDRALASPHLPARAKHLVFAVVARSLPCPTTEAEAVRLLAGDGLSPADVDEVLRTLSSPRLDPIETKLVGFARSSVRYDFLEIQERVERELASVFTPAQLIEAVGVTALANSVARLAMFAA